MTDTELAPIPGTAPGTHMVSCGACHLVDESDDHPKVVRVGGPDYHFDCMPPRAEADLLGNIDEVGRLRYEAMVAAATAEGANHLHGHDLRVLGINLRFEHPREDELPLTDHERAFLTHVGAVLPGVTTKKGGKSNG